MIADATFAHVAIRHFDSPGRFADAAQAVIDLAPRALDTVARWQAVQLTDVTRAEFGRRAAALRWTPEQPIAESISAGAILQPLRYGDHAHDLWTTFNVVQEQHMFY